jgi:hypothetical protein
LLNRQSLYIFILFLARVTLNYINKVRLVPGLAALRLPHPQWDV